MHMQQREKCTEANATPAWVRTESLYLPSRRKMDEMTAAELRRGLCAKSAGNWHACEHCGGGCGIGRRLVAIMRGEVEEPRPEEITPHFMGEPAQPERRYGYNNRFSAERWKEVAEDIVRRVQAGESFRAACAAREVHENTVRSYMHTHGIATPQCPDRLEHIKAAREKGAVVRIAKSIHRAALAAEAMEQGMSRSKAARAYGYSQWHNVQRTLDKYPAKVAAERQRIREGQT